MGFLKFLKRGKKREDFGDLDLPPAPPPLDDFPADFDASFSGFGEKTQEFPEFPELNEDKLPEEPPKFDFPEMEEKMPELGQEESMPEMPGFPEMEQEPMQQIAPIRVPEQMPPMPERMPDEMPEAEEKETAQEEAKTEVPEAYPRMGRRLFEHEKRLFRERPKAKTIYIKVENFKAMLGSINMARSGLRSSEEAIMKLENIKASKDKSFDKIKSSLDDLQKKLIFVDKTLFKGDGN